MTKEQEAIKNIKIYIHDRINESVDEDGYERYAIDEWDKEFINAIETVLSMLKEKDKEIEEYKRMIAAGIINTAKDELVQQKNKEIEKKDKQINFMANFINDNTPYTKDTKELENEEGIRTAEFTTKYFERKSEE